MATEYHITSGDYGWTITVTGSAELTIQTDSPITGRERMVNKIAAVSASSDGTAVRLIQYLTRRSDHGNG